MYLLDTPAMAVVEPVGHDVQETLPGADLNVPAGQGEQTVAEEGYCPLPHGTSAVSVSESEPMRLAQDCETRSSSLHTRACFHTYTHAYTCLYMPV